MIHVFRSPLLRKIHSLELKYENLIIAIIMIFAAVMIATPPLVHTILDFIRSMGEVGYLGSVVAGFFCGYGLTAPVAYATIFALGNVLHPLLIAILAAAGATVADFIIYSIARRKLASELAAVERRIGMKKVPRWVHHMAPFVAGFIIASPLPDELAAGLLGGLRFSEKKFILLIYAAHFIGMAAVAGLGSYIIA